MHQFQRRVLSSGQVLDKTHDEAVVVRSLNHNSWNLTLPEREKRFQPSLPTHEIVTGSIVTRGDGNRLLEAEMGNACYKFLEDFLVSRTGIEDGNRGDWHCPHFKAVRDHAAVLM